MYIRRACGVGSYDDAKNNIISVMTTLGKVCKSFINVQLEKHGRTRSAMLLRLNAQIIKLKEHAAAAARERGRSPP